MILNINIIILYKILIIIYENTSLSALFIRIIHKLVIYIYINMFNYYIKNVISSMKNSQYIL